MGMGIMAALTAMLAALSKHHEPDSRTVYK
jgi:hypothetical protein